MSSHVVSVRTNVIVFVVLLVLLFATIGAAYLPLGPLHLPLALSIAAAKAVLIGLFFMHIYYRHHLTWIVSIASLFWLGILLALTLGDYLSRGWLDIPGK
jgi:cytochrome c oxidase subunit IV